MTVKTWRALSMAAKFVKYHISRKLGERLQDKVDDLYEHIV